MHASTPIFLFQIALLIAFGRLLGEVAQRIGQPAVMGNLCAGLLLGPSVFGEFLPHLHSIVFPTNVEQKGMLDAVSQLGVLMLLLLTGMETQLAVVRKVQRAAIGVSIAGIALPFACGYISGQLLPDALIPSPQIRTVTALFLGTALSISSVKIVAMVIREMEFTHRRVGRVLIASAILDDTIGWVIVAVIFGILRRGSVDFIGLMKSIALTLAFLAVSFTVGRRAVAYLIRWTNDRLQSEMAVISVILVVMCAMALITDAIGVHTVLGAFVAGMLVGQSPILTRHIDEQLRGMIVALFMPIFFGLAGLEADLTIINSKELLAWTLGIVAIATLGKAAGAFIGALFGKLSMRESIALAFGMNARGSTEVIVATIGLRMGALSEKLYTLIVAMAILTTLMMPPTLRWALSRIPLTDEEKQRLEQEEFAKRGYVPMLERLLTAVDDSPSGRLTSWLAGLLAGPRGMPVTVVELEPAAPQEKVAETQAPAVTEAAMEEAQPPRETEAEATPSSGRSVEVRRRADDEDSEEAIAAEADKGFDLLWVGCEPGVDRTGAISPLIARIVRRFDGDFALCFARGQKAKDLEAKPLHLLVPITGTAYSRKAVEVALALAQASNGSVTALHVGRAPQSWTGKLRRSMTIDQEALAILKEVSELARIYGARAQTRMEASASADRAILRAAARNNYSAILMGVTPRPGDTLHFGNVPQAVLADTPISVVLVSS